MFYCRIKTLPPDVSYKRIKPVANIVSRRNKQVEIGLPLMESKSEPAATPVPEEGKKYIFCTIITL